MSDQFDAIVIGSGLGGLTAGAMFAKQGKRVLVLERHDKFGGAATVFHRQKVDVEVALHLMDGMDEDDVKIETWNTLGLKDRVEVLSLPEFYSITLPGKEDVFCIPESVEDAQNVLIAKFPQQKQSIKKYFREIVLIRSGLSALFRFEKSPLFWLFQFPKVIVSLIRDNNKDVAQYFDELFGDNEDIKMILGANFGYYTNDPTRMPKTVFAMGQAAYQVGGAHYIKGGSQALSNALVDIIKEGGGEARTSRYVSEIMIEDGRVVGVEHIKSTSIPKQKRAMQKSFKEGALTEDSSPANQFTIKPRIEHEREKSYAPIIFGNAAPVALKEMLPGKYAKRFYKPYKDRTLSQTCFTLFLGLDKKPEEFGARHYTHIFISNTKKRFRDVKNDCRMFSKTPKECNGNVPGYGFTDYSRVDSGLNQKGRYFVCVCGLDHIDNWAHLSDFEYYRKKELWEEALVEDVNKRYPGIKDAIVFKDFGTARTIRDYLNTPGGAILGYELKTPYPFDKDLKRIIPNSVTAVKGLYIASVYAMAGGFTGAMVSGGLAAKQASRYRN